MTLELHDVHAYYGQSHILHGISLTVGTGEVVALLGRNGAGKTTTLRAIMGLTPARSGRILFDGQDITHKPTHVIARLGISYVPSGRRLFGQLTVLQNLQLWQQPPRDGGRWTIERVYEVFPKLAEFARRRAGSLSGGEQQMLKIGRALLANPKLLLLDEPTEGLAPAVVGQLGQWLKLLKDAGLSMLLAEQNALFALKLADRGYVLEKGQIRYAAPAEELRQSPEVRTYLGV
jgi:branched-chain amino acid transport system ATP-binding protein